MSVHEAVTAYMKLVADLSAPAEVPTADREPTIQRLEAIVRAAEQHGSKLGCHLAGVAQGTIRLLEELWLEEET